MQRKNFLFLAFLTLTVVTGYWFFLNYKIVKKAADLTTTSTTQTTRTVSRAISSEPVTNPQTKPTAAAPTQQPDPQLDLERQKLELQRQTLESLKARRDQQLQQMTFLYPNQIGSNTIQIQNLTQSLQSQRVAESDIQASTTAAFREQSSAERYAIERINLDIEKLEASIRQDTASLVSNPTQVGTIDEQTRLANLQILLAQQNEQLALLKEQRVNILANTYQQTKAINNISQGQKSDLISNQNSILNEISSLRDENLRLQNDVIQTRTSLIPLNQQINQAEQAYQESLRKVKTLEQSTVVR